MLPIDPTLLERAWAGALPGREQAALNAVLRVVIEALHPRRQLGDSNALLAKNPSVHGGRGMKARALS